MSLTYITHLSSQHVYALIAKRMSPLIITGFDGIAVWVLASVNEITVTLYHFTSITLTHINKGITVLFLNDHTCTLPLSLSTLQQPSVMVWRRQKTLNVYSSSLIPNGIVLVTIYIVKLGQKILLNHY